VNIAYSISKIFSLSRGNIRNIKECINNINISRQNGCFGGDNSRFGNKIPLPGLPGKDIYVIKMKIKLKLSRNGGWCVY
jgi:hypothetical protein